MHDLLFKNLSPVKSREQSGCFHVILNSNYQNIIFCNDLDRIMFLRIIEMYRNKFDASIYAITLMHTHVHMLIECNELSEIMRRALRDFSMWYNMNRQQKGSIFRGPFSSFVIKSEEKALETLLYILRNPYVDGLVSNPRYYKWSSYNCYFSGNAAISRYIEIDTSIVRKYYGNSRELYNAVTYVPENKIEKFELTSKRVKDAEVIMYIDTLLDGRQVVGLASDEIRDIIIDVRNHMPVSVRQLSSVLHVGKEFVRRIIRSSCI